MGRGMLAAEGSRRKRSVAEAGDGLRGARALLSSDLSGARVCSMCALATTAAASGKRRNVADNTTGMLKESDDKSCHRPVISSNTSLADRDCTLSRT